MKDNVLQEKSFAFAVRVVRMAQFLAVKSVDQVLAKQILRSGTSVGANVEEAIAAQSRRDFVNKLQIARKEARETHYWLRLMAATEIVKPEHINSVVADAEELLRILTSIIKTSTDTIKETEVQYGTNKTNDAESQSQERSAEPTLYPFDHPRTWQQTQT